MTATSSPSPYRWYVLAVLTLAQTCHGIDRAIIGLVLPPLKLEFGLTGAQLGFLAGLAYGVPFALAAIPFGFAVDRFNRKALMTAALSAWSAATALCGLATGFWSLFAGRAAVGVAEAGGSPTGMSILSDYFDERKRATAIGIWYLSSGVGTAVAFFAGGAIVEAHGWRWAFFAAGIPGLVLAPLLFLTVREPRRGNQDADTESHLAAAPLGQRLRLLFARPGIGYCVAAITCIATAIYGMSIWLASFLIASHGFGIAKAGLTVAIAYGILGSFGGLAAGWIADRLNARRGGFDPARTALLGALIPFATAASGLAAVASNDIVAVLGFLMIAGFFSAAYNGPIYAVIVTIAGPQLRGLAVSAVQLSANLIGVGLGAWLIGKVSDVVGGKDGIAWGIGTALLFCVAGGILLLLASRRDPNACNHNSELTMDPQAPAQYVAPVVDPNCVPRPYPARTDHLPTSMHGIDAAWLSRMLSYKYSGVVAKTMETVEILNSHTTKWRIRVEWNEAGVAAGLPANMCMKANWSGSFDNVDIHALEARFYHFMVGEMKVPTARCLYADWDDNGSAHGFIVLEDLNDRGGAFGHSTNRNGVAAIEANLEGLAKLHGSLWGSDKLAPANAPWLQTQMDTPVDSDQVRIMWQWIEANLADPGFCAVAPQHYLDDPRKVERAFDRLGEIERGLSTPHCIVLGDCHQGNTYILPGGERLWLDWQLVRRGRPWRDLTYFVVGALTIAERRAHHRDLVAQYREHLLATGAQGVPSFDEAWEQTRLWVMYGVQAWVANMDSWGQNGIPMNERFFTAAEDLGTWKLLGE